MHVLKKLGKEPLFHFLILAALLFLFDYLFSSTQKEKIIVDRQTVEYLIKQREDLELRKLSAEERKQTVDSFVEDEILYSEAYKRGLDKGDSRMRRNLILKMRSLLIGDLKRPTEKELRDYYEANRAKFTTTATVSLQQVFYSDPTQLPGGILEKLQAGLDPSKFGEFQSGLGRSLPRLSRIGLVGTFGAEAARIILAIDDSRWHGPIKSIYGVHFVRITDREPAQQARYEDVKSYLEGDWLMAQSRKAIEQEMEKLSNNYEIVIEEVGEATQ